MVAMTRGTAPAVIVVDDDLGILSALQRLVRNEPYELLATTDPLEALRWLVNRKVRALVVDERMPELAGSELLAWVRVRFPEMPCVILTSYADSALLVRQNRLRVQHLVLKPWDDEYLRSLLRALAG